MAASVQHRKTQRHKIEPTTISNVEHDCANIGREALLSSLFTLPRPSLVVLLMSALLTPDKIRILFLSHNTTEIEFHRPGCWQQSTAGAGA